MSLEKSALQLPLCTSIGVFAPFTNGILLMPHLQIEFYFYHYVLSKIPFANGALSKYSFYKWSKHPITVMGIVHRA